MIKRVVILGMGIYLIFHSGPFVLAHLRAVFVCVIAAVILTYMLLPIVDSIARKRRLGIKKATIRLIATILVVIVFLTLLGLVIALFVSPIKDEVNHFIINISSHRARVGELVERAETWYAKVVPNVIKENLAKTDYTKIANQASNYIQDLAKVATSSLGIVVEIFLIPVLTFYFLYDYRTLSREFYSLIPKAKRRDAIRMGRRIGEIMQSYVFGQLLLCVIAGVLTWVILVIMGMPYAVVLGLFSGITRAIPVIGPVVSGVPIVLVGVLNSTTFATPVYLLVFVVIMHFAESKFIMPHLIGERLELHPATVIIVLLIGAAFFGLLGMFLAAPVAAIARELLRFYYIAPMRAAERGD